MPRRRRSEEEERALLLVQGDLTALAQHPAWPTFEAEVEKQIVKIQRIVLARTLGTGNFTESEIAFWRGLVKGMRWLTVAPSTAERELERYLQRKEAMSANE
jgi:hypothetical protein